MDKKEVIDILDGIRSRIEGKIESAEKILPNCPKLLDNSFMKGCIAGLRTALQTIPPNETIGIKCEDR